MVEHDKDTIDTSIWRPRHRRDEVLLPAEQRPYHWLWNTKGYGAPPISEASPIWWPRDPAKRPSGPPADGIWRPRQAPHQTDLPAAGGIWRPRHAPPQGDGRAVDESLPNQPPNPAAETRQPPVSEVIPRPAAPMVVWAAAERQRVALAHCGHCAALSDAEHAAWCPERWLPSSLTD